MSEPSLNLDDRVIGQTEGIVELPNLAAIREATLHMLLQARQRVLILTRDLDAPVYDRKPFVEAVTRLATQASRARIHIILQENQRVVHQGHRLIESSRRLTSNIEIRRPIEEYRDYAENFMVVDHSACLYRERASIYTATADYHAPLRARRLEELFLEIWEHSEPDRELQRLYL